jgi:hypothetical protein
MELLERQGKIWEIASLNPNMALAGVGYGFPHKQDYVKNDIFDEKAWIGAVGKFIISRVSEVASQRQRINEISIQLYNQITQTSKTPDYATGDGKTAVGSIAYENINVIYSGLEQIIGELASKGFEYDVTVNNSEARSRQEKSFTDLYLRHYMEKNAPELAQLTGIQTTEKEKEALELETNLNRVHENLYRDVVAKGCEVLLGDWMKRSGFTEWYQQTARQFVITNMACAVPTIDPFSFEVKLPYIDNSQFIWDVDCKEDHFRNAQYFIQYKYISINEVLEMFPNASRDDVERLATSNPTFWGLPVSTRHTHRSGLQIVMATVRFLYVDTHEIKVDSISGIEITSKQENETLDLSARLLVDKKSYPFRYQECYEVKFIAGTILASAQKCPYQLRSVETPADTKIGSETLIMGYALDPNSPSVAARVMGLQHYLNAAIFKAMELIGKMRGGILEIDMDYLYQFLPNDAKENFNETIKLLRDQGTILKSSALSSDYQHGGTSPPLIRMVDGGIPNQEINIINGYVQFLTSEIQKLMGLNQTRLGQTPQYQAASSALSDLTQSNYSTATLILEWDKFVERTLNTVMNYLKLSLFLKVRALGNNPDLIRSLYFRYGEEVIQMAMDENLILEDVGVSVQRARESEAEKRARIMKWVEIGISQQQLDVLQAIKIGSIQNPDDMEKYVDRAIRMKEKLAEKQMQQQQQSQEQMLAQKQSGDQQMQQNQISADLIKQQAGAMNGITNDVVKNAMRGTASAANTQINLAAQKVQDAVPTVLR